MKMLEKLEKCDDYSDFNIFQEEIGESSEIPEDHVLAVNQENSFACSDFGGNSEIQMVLQISNNLDQV